MSDRAITDDGDFCAGADSMAEWDQWLLYYANVKGKNPCEVPLDFDQWRNWKHEEEMKQVANEGR